MNDSRSFTVVILLASPCIYHYHLLPIILHPHAHRKLDCCAMIHTVNDLRSFTTMHLSSISNPLLLHPITMTAFPMFRSSLSARIDTLDTTVSLPHSYSARHNNQSRSTHPPCHTATDLHSVATISRQTLPLTTISQHHTSFFSNIPFIRIFPTLSHQQHTQPTTMARSLAKIKNALRATARTNRRIPHPVPTRTTRLSTTNLSGYNLAREYLPHFRSNHNHYAR